MGQKISVLLITVILWAAAQGDCNVPGQTINQSAGLKNLEISSALSPDIALDPTFSPSVYNYTVAVDSTNVRQVKIVPTSFPDQNTVTINNTKIDSTKPYQADLKLGDNKFIISVASKGQNAVRYSLTILRKDLSGQYKCQLVQKGI